MTRVRVRVAQFTGTATAARNGTVKQCLRPQTRVRITNVRFKSSRRAVGFVHAIWRLYNVIISIIIPLMFVEKPTTGETSIKCFIDNYRTSTFYFCKII